MSKVEVKSVTSDLWDDQLTLFGSSGAFSGCWCMWWREKSSEFEANGNAGNKAAMQDLVAQNEVPGLLAYLDGVPVGWLSLGPRDHFGRLERSPILKRVDEQPVWSIVCFFIARPHRSQGIAKALLQAAIDYAQERGASALEAYPIDTGGRRTQPNRIFTGTQALFEAAGFVEVARRKPARPILRKTLSPA